jgi:hypothetical protein
MTKQTYYMTSQQPAEEKFIPLLKTKYREVPNDWPIMIQGKERQVTPQQNGNKALLLG